MIMDQIFLLRLLNLQNISPTWSLSQSPLPVPELAATYLIIRLDEMNENQILFGFERQLSET